MMDNNNVNDEVGNDEITSDCLQKIWTFVQALNTENIEYKDADEDYIFKKDLLDASCNLVGFLNDNFESLVKMVYSCYSQFSRIFINLRHDPGDNVDMLWISIDGKLFCIFYLDLLKHITPFIPYDDRYCYSSNVFFSRSLPLDNNCNVYNEKKRKFDQFIKDLKGHCSTSSKQFFSFSSSFSKNNSTLLKDLNDTKESLEEMVKNLNSFFEKDLNWCIYSPDLESNKIRDSFLWRPDAGEESYKPFDSIIHEEIDKVKKYYKYYNYRISNPCSPTNLDSEEETIKGIKVSMFVKDYRKYLTDKIKKYLDICRYEICRTAQSDRWRGNMCNMMQDFQSRIWKDINDNMGKVLVILQEIGEHAEEDQIDEIVKNLKESKNQILQSFDDNTDALIKTSEHDGGTVIDEANKALEECREKISKILDDLIEQCKEINKYDGEAIIEKIIKDLEECREDIFKNIDNNKDELDRKLKEMDLLNDHTYMDNNCRMILKEMDLLNEYTSGIVPKMRELLSMFTIENKLKKILHREGNKEDKTPDAAHRSNWISKISNAPKKPLNKSKDNQENQNKESCDIPGDIDEEKITKEKITSDLNFKISESLDRIEAKIRQLRKKCNFKKSLSKMTDGDDGEIESVKNMFKAQAYIVEYREIKIYTANQNLLDFLKECSEFEFGNTKKEIKEAKEREHLLRLNKGLLNSAFYPLIVFASKHRISFRFLTLFFALASILPSVRDCIDISWNNKYVWIILSSKICILSLFICCSMEIAVDRYNKIGKANESDLDKGIKKEKKKYNDAIKKLKKIKKEIKAFNKSINEKAKEVKNKESTAEEKIYEPIYKLLIFEDGQKSITEWEF